jgi:S1-C subfamily serine protease
VRLAAVREAGAAWHSAAGGRIDALLRLDMRASRAEEGGPVIDAAGRLIGMATAGPRGRALVIPHATIARAVQSILAHGTMRGGWLGVGLQPVSIPPTLHAAAGQETGLMAVSLAAGGPAEQAGILPGDILLALDGEAMIRLRGIRGKLGADRVGQEVEIKLMRGGVAQAVKLTVGARPAR